MPVKVAVLPEPFRWRKGRVCWVNHPCPNKEYPNHHDAECSCTDIRPIGQCDLCQSLVCGACKATIL